MRLSEAIRVGAKKRPQCVKQYIANGCSCAMGAAYEAVGVIDGRGEFAAGDADARWDREWNVMADRPTTCPACSKGPLRNLHTAITHLNDHHRWTREAIADWVETLESPAPERG